jgi:U4/U6.U5 tri-snRNP-associated protein 1
VNISLKDFERELVEARRKQEMDDEVNSGWHHVEIDTSAVEIQNEEKGVLDDEPVVNEGIGAALLLAQKKGDFLSCVTVCPIQFNSHFFLSLGYLDQKSKKGAQAGSSKHLDLEAKNYSIEDKRYE